MRTRQPILDTHRRLIACLIWQGILTESEARSAIIAQRQGDGRLGGAEAVVHYGGATKLIGDAFRHRHIIIGRPRVGA